MFRKNSSRGIDFETRFNDFHAEMLDKILICMPTSALYEKKNQNFLNQTEKLLVCRYLFYVTLNLTVFFSTPTIFC